MLNDTHDSHSDVVNKALARERLFWNSMKSAFQCKFGRLKICARNQANNPNMDENGATRLAI